MSAGTSERTGRGGRSQRGERGQGGDRGQGGNRGQRGDRSQRGDGGERIEGELSESIVKIKRCAAVVKGGRRFSFAAMVVVGDGKGKVGWGYGKANEVPPSVEKARKEGMRSLVTVTLDG
jgi:small subunit ribosomal protein S5